MKNLIAIGIGFLLAFLLVEIILQCYNPFEFRQKGNRIVLPTNSKAKLDNDSVKGLDSIIIHTKNSMGFRGDERPENFENWTSIIAVGGSTTECYLNSDSKGWVALLGKDLTEKHESLWINNAGFSGHSTFGHQILLEDYLIGLRPDYILFLVGINDVGREDLTKFDKASLTKNDSWKDYLMNNSEFVSLLVNLRRVFFAHKSQLGHCSIDFQSLEIFEKVDTTAINKMLEHHQMTYIKPYESRLMKLIKTTLENGIIPILITQPCPVGEGIDESTGLDLKRIKGCDDLGGKSYWEKLELYNDVTRKVAKDEQIMLIDLANEMPKSLALYYDCIHFTNKGAEVVSDIIFEEMEILLEKK